MSDAYPGSAGPERPASLQERNAAHDRIRLLDTMDLGRAIEDLDTLEFVDRLRGLLPRW